MKKWLEKNLIGTLFFLSIVVVALLKVMIDAKSETNSYTNEIIDNQKYSDTVAVDNRYMNGFNDMKDEAVYIVLHYGDIYGISDETIECIIDEIYFCKNDRNPDDGYSYNEGYAEMKEKAADAVSEYGWNNNLDDEIIDNIIDVIYDCRP